VEQALKKEDADRLVFEAADVLKRVEKMGDLSEPLLRLKQKLPQLAGLGAEPEKPTEEKKDRVAIAAQAEPRPRAKKTAVTAKKRRKV